MKITRRDEALGARPAQSEHFTGPVAQLVLQSQTEPRTVRVSVVHFHDGARNHWHSHSGGQVLHVIDGQGEVQSWEGEVRQVRAGDSVAAEPGEKHWHGAAPGASMAHVAVTIGEISWMEPPPVA